jgi:cell division protein FtsB
MTMRRFVLGGLFAAAAYFALFGGEYSALDLLRIAGEVEDARVALVQLEEETARLQERAELLESDRRTLETLARENFGMIRDGEILYRFAGPAP